MNHNAKVTKKRIPCLSNPPETGGDCLGWVFPNEQYFTQPDGRNFCLSCQYETIETARNTITPPKEWEDAA